MKNFTLVILGLFGFTGIYAQTFDDTTESIANAEMKSAFSTMGVAINEDTYNYDVVYQRLELEVDPAVYFISGTITTDYTALEDMNTIVFDLTTQLDVTSVIQNGNNLAFSQSNEELIITLQTAQSAGTSRTITVNYSGEPAWEEQGFVASEHNGVPIIWTLSEPFGAKDWWPCKQDLNDKIESIDVFITTPQQYVSVSNGVEQSQELNGDGTKTTHFHHSYPIPAYLIAIAVTNYSVFIQQAGTEPNTFPIVNYIYPENFGPAQEELAQTLPIMDFYEDLFETYPFHEEKYGHAQCGFGGGMEHTTVSFMGNFNRDLIAHELGHQWFGDKITCGSWKDIWLNEGFATFLSGLVIQHLDGEFSFTNWKASRTISITSDPGGNIYLTDEQAENSNRIFSSRLSYNKGAMVLNMLRLKLGDDDFFQGVRNYLADPELAYGYATTPDFQAHLEDVSGTDLDEFFNDWVYMQGFPNYNFTMEDLGGGQVKLTVSQTQSHPSVDYFEMPLPVRFTGNGGETFDVMLDNTFNGQEFTVNVLFAVNGFVFDPGHDIICSNSAFLGVEDVELTTVALYPNPADDVLQVTLPQGATLQKAIFYNALGQKVMESNGETSWNVSALSQGVHYITLITDEGIKQLHFIKM